MSKAMRFKARPHGLVFLGCLILFVSCTFAKKPEHNRAQNVPEKDSVDVIIAQEVAKLMKQPGYTAVSGVIYLKGKVHHFHFGQLQNGKKPDNNTVYEIGSITKTYTGLLLAQAVSDHKIGLDDDVRTYLKDQYPNLVLSGGRPITFRHLITHTSGLPLHMNCYDGITTVAEQIDCFKNMKQSDFFATLKNVKLMDNSGTNYRYSSVGTQLVGYILEQVYQLSFQDLFQKYIFMRSGEKQTFSALAYDKGANISIGKDSIGRSMPLINGFYTYSGGMKSTTNAMLAYMKMYLESKDKIVLKATDRLAGTAQYGRAYAWNTYNYDQEMKMLYHNGGSFGHSSWIALYPNQKTGIFMVTNVVTADSQSKLNELSNIIIDRIGIYYY